LRIRGPVVLYQPRDQGYVMPLGLLQLGSALRGQPVEIVDGRLDLAPEARVAGLAREALLLGVTVRTGRPIADALRISRAVRTANPDLPIVWGGPHPTLFPGPCLSSEAVDACVAGAGEETIAEAVAALRAGGRGFSGVAGLAWRAGDDVVTEPPRGPFDTTRWARADYGLLELDPYFRARGARRLDYCSSRWPWPALPGPAGEVAPLEWSALSPDRVVEDIRELGSRLRPDEVAFQDDDLFADSRRAEAIGRGLLEAGVRIAWSASGRAAVLARLGAESFRALAASGCVRIHVRTPGEMTLPGDAGEAILETARRLQAAGIGARFSFRAGFPGQGAEGLAAIHRLACTLRRMDARFETPIRLYAPFPGGPGSNAPGFRIPEGLEEWAEAGLETGGPWIPAALRRRALRYHFFLSEAYRPPGRRWGKRLLRLVARGRVRLGFYGVDVERRVVEWSARLRTGRDRGPALADD